MNNFPNLLIVDDSKENLELLEQVIRKLNVNLILALSGVEALEKSKGLELALAIIDVRMPEMNGYELALRMNEERLEVKVPIIFLTASHLNETQVFEGYGSGAVDYIFKPIDNHILLCKINVFLDLFNQRQTIIGDAALLKKYAGELNSVIDILKKSEEKYRSYVDNAPDGVFVADETGKYIEANEAACRITGFTREEILTMSISDFLPEESFDKGIAHFKSLILNGSSRSDLLFKHKNGTKRWWTIDAVRLTENRYLGFAKDITHRVEMEAALRSQQFELEMQNNQLSVAIIDAKTASDKYAELYDFAPSGYFTLSEDCEILELNHGGAQLLGKARSQLIDNYFDSFISSNTLPDFQTFFRCVFQSETKELCEVLIEADGINPTWVHIQGVVIGNGKQCIINVIDITKQKRLEEKLKSSEVNFRTFFDTMSDMIFIGNDKGEIFYVNNAVSSKLGYSKEKLQSMHVLDVHPQNSRSEAEKIFNDMFTGKLESCTLPFVRTDGFLVPVETRVWFGKWDGKDCIFAISKDLSAEQEALQKFNKIFASNPALMAISSFPDILFTDVNDTFLDKTEFSKDEVIGKTSEMLDLFVQPEIQKAITAELEKNGFIHNCELQVKTKTGKILHGLFSGEIIESQAKKFFLTVMVDITERKVAEQTLKISEEKYKTMLNASPDGILLIDKKGFIIEVSEIGLEIFAAESRNDLVGKNILRFIPTTEKKIINEIFEKTMSEGLAQNIQVKIRKINNSIFAGETSVTLIQGSDGAPLSFMIIVRDISHRKKMETKQIHADRMANLGEMASGIAHEINQPLNIISMVMDKILFETSRSNTIDIDFLKNKSDKIFENIIRIRNIIDHIRAFSRSHDDYILTAFDINATIENAVSMIAEQFKHLGIKLQLQLEKKIPQINGNTYKFEQVIINLLVNAKDAVMEKKDKQEDYFEMMVEIKSYQDHQTLIVEVSDNGTGISDEDINNIMLPFYTTKDEGKGTGLGLSICYQIIKEMDGTIDIMKNNSHGTTVKLVLDIQENK